MNHRNILPDAVHCRRSNPLAFYIRAVLPPPRRSRRRGSRRGGEQSRHSADAFPVLLH